MKKIILVFISLILVSCSNDNNTEKENISNQDFKKSLQTEEKLSNNSDYIKLVIEMESFKNFIKQIIDDEKLDLNDVQSELSILNSQNLNYEAQIERINLIFKTDVSKKYTEHYSIYSEKWSIISKKYANLHIENIEEAYSEVLAKVALSGDCGWRYSLCITAAGAGAVLCHAGCDTTALATTAGLGIPACIWLCGTLQVMASVQCYDTYC